MFYSNYPADGFPVYWPVSQDSAEESAVIDKSVFTSDVTNPRLSHILAKQDKVAWWFPVATRTDTIVVSNDALSFCTQHALHDK